MVGFIKRMFNSKKISSVKGYQIGSVLKKLEYDLVPYECEYIKVGTFIFKPHHDLIVRVQEQPRGLFLAHITHTQFIIKGELPSSYQSAVGEIVFKTTGMFKRTGINLKFLGVSPNRLSEQFIFLWKMHDELSLQLRGVDFQRAWLKFESGQWQFVIEHFAASEVVSRIPSSKRYLKLIPQQRHALLSSLLMMNQLFSKFA